MTPAVRLFAPDRVEITDLDSWFRHAPPEGGEAQWRDAHSAKEQARAWTRPGRPEVPGEVWSAIGPLAPADVDEIYGRPEHPTKLDDYGRGRRHDLFACARSGGDTVLVAGVEAKACEGFAGTVADRAAASAPSEERARCNLLARALFGRDVLDETSGEILDRGLAGHGYQLWTAAVGTIIEAQRREVARAALVVHQFVPADLSSAAGDARRWRSALETNEQRFEQFRAALEAAGSTSHRTQFVEPGTEIGAIEVRSVI